MAQPVTMFLYEKLLPGGQLVNRLQDLGYRVVTLSDPRQLVEHAEREKPLFVIADLEPRDTDNCAAITRLKKNSATAHIPVIAIAGAEKTALQENARQAGATLVVNDQAILVHLSELLEQALHVE